MLSRKLACILLAVSAGSAMLMLSMGQASAFTLASPSIQQHYASSSKIEEAYYRCRWRNGRRYCRHYY
jgi:hypothetical protein